LVACLPEKPRARITPNSPDKKTGMPFSFQATRLAYAPKTRGFPSLPCNGFGFKDIVVLILFVGTSVPEPPFGIATLLQG
jgi:hypothetical protein